MCHTEMQRAENPAVYPTVRGEPHISVPCQTGIAEPEQYVVHKLSFPWLCLLEPLIMPAVGVGGAICHEGGATGQGCSVSGCSCANITCQMVDQFTIYSHTPVHRTVEL